ncbi:GAF domain-containing hybrid sensor histidine kinase/response regulator [Desulfopila inferna]|uniref:GAF domain-containing hybrid sensor histidine kinase/response regulator n=1 Tax=Desulfopila inferna TaxID=468528 RepID=UPI001965F72C|nr:PAS domain S-box protein [Desulfopila inferna]MBM9603789.1 PAS domain S-box protein [Desulfopila inferna]
MKTWKYTDRDQEGSGKVFEDAEKPHFHIAQPPEENSEINREIGERKRAEQITRTLFRISNAVNTTKSLDELYGSIHRILGEIINLSNFFIAVYHKPTGRVAFPYFIDLYDSADVYADQINKSNSLTGEVIRKQKAIFLDKADLQLRAAENRLVGTAPIAWLGVPLKIKGEVIGVMAAQCYEEPHPFNLIDLEILNSVSEQIALAIERKRNEQALITSEKKYRTIIESIEDGYYEIDPQGRLNLVNQALCGMLGYEENYLVGMNALGFMSEESQRKIKESFASILQTDQPGITLELQLHRSDGGIRYVETVISAVCSDDAGPVGYRGIARDITERKSADHSRKVLEQQLQQSQRLESLGTLAGGIAHDFNNLLMGIQGRIELILKDLEEEHPHHLQLATIESYLESAASLTTRLLGFARGGKYQVQPVDLNALTEKSTQMFGRTKKELSISCTLQKDLLPIEADSSQIEQVLLNLLVNAGQAMAAGGHIAVTTGLSQIDENEARFHDITPGKYVQLTLSDNGKGMDKETLGKIFDPFFTTKARGGGTGLGLAMVYGIIRNHSGAVSVKSELNRGTTFTLLLPASHKKIPSEIERSSTVVKGSGMILLVDDESMIIEVAQEILAVLGYQVLTAASGREALEVYASNRKSIDLVIIDMIMPRMSGGELFDRLKEMDPEVKVLLASGYSIEGEAREILKRGCKGFIQKPFTISELSAKLSRLLV